MSESGLTAERHAGWLELFFDLVATLALATVAPLVGELVADPREDVGDPTAERMVWILAAGVLVAVSGSARRAASSARNT